MKRRTLLLGMSLAIAQVPAHAQANNYPSKPIRIVVPFAAGSGSDTGSRVYGEVLSRLLGQPVIVENRPGASGLVTIQAVKSAPADGYTIMLASNSPMTVNPVVMKNLPYDPVKDFRPIIGLGKGAVAFVVRADSPYKTINDLIDAAKKDRRPLAIGNYSAGYQLVAAWLGTASGTEVTHVAYKGGMQMMTDIIGKQLDVGAIDFGGAVPLIRDGRLRALVVTRDKRYPGFPDIPTMKESGFPNFETYVWSSFYVRAETPDDIVQKLADTMQKVMLSEEASAYHATTPNDVMAAKPDEMRKFQLAEYERFRRVAEAAGIKPQ